MDEPKLLSREDELYIASLYAAVRENIVTWNYIKTIEYRVNYSTAEESIYKHLDQILWFQEEETDELHDRLYEIKYGWGVKWPKDIEAWYLDRIPF